jgi:abortive infection bacteriophage resistance protein
MKSKGITFNRCTEIEAANYLQDKTYFFKIYSYRVLYQKRIGGARNGEYVGLDFANLKELASLDQQLRYAMLPMTLNQAIQHELDSYEVVKDYMESLNVDERKRRVNDITQSRFDAYRKDLFEKYKTHMPMWVFLELISFGAYIDFYRYCAQRWGDKRMTSEHYLLRSVKALRNACAHSSCIVNNFCKANSPYKVPVEIHRVLSNAGITKTSRNKQLKNIPMQQIVVTTYTNNVFNNGDTSQQLTQARIRTLVNTLDVCIKNNQMNEKLQASLLFLKNIFTKVGK